MSEAPTPEAVPESPPIGDAAPVTPVVENSVLSESPSGAETAPADAGNDTVTSGEGNDSIAAEASELKIEDLKLADGFEADPEAMAEFGEFAKQNGLKQEQAQAALDLFQKNVQAQVAKLVQDQRAAWKTITDGWVSELDKTPEFSGDNKVKSQQIIGRALDEYGSPEAREAFNLTGAGNNPAVVKFIYSMAKALDEGTPLPQGNPTLGTGPRTPGQVFYPPEGN